MPNIAIKLAMKIMAHSSSVGIAAGAALGTNVLDAVDDGPLPKLLVANTVQVYVLPLVSPVTVSGEAEPVRLPEVPPLLDVQVAV